ncbi:MAG: TonB-dependent receptor domain-containing protein [Nevskiales bacterium]
MEYSRGRLLVAVLGVTLYASGAHRLALAEEPADPATAPAAQGEGAPATTDSVTPPSSAEGATTPPTNSSNSAPVGRDEIDDILAEEPADPATASAAQGEGAPAETDSATPPSSAEGDAAPATNRSDSAAAAAGLEELDDILAEEPADPATVSAAQGEGAPATTDSTTPPSSAEGDAAPATTSTKKAPVTVGLEEIIVTATKREVSVREIAATVNVLSGEDLEAIDAREMQDYLRLVPGITLQEGLNGSRSLAVRGVGPQSGGNITTGVLIDNVSMGDPVASYLVPDLDPFDLQTVEVLKGPQGTLFGAGALNGAIRYVLTKPQLSTLDAKGFVNRLTVEQGGEGVTWGAAVNIPLGEEAALRAAAVSQELPGLYDDVNANGKNQKDADEGDKQMSRVLGLWKPTDALKITAFYLQQENFRGDLSVANNLDFEFVRTNTPGPSTSRQKFDVANLEVSYDFDWASLISETSRAKKLNDTDFDLSSIVEPLAVAGIESLRLHTRIDTDAISQELRLVSAPSDSPWVWLGGLYYSRYSAVLELNTFLANTAILAQLFDALNLPPELQSQLTPTPEGLSVIFVRFDPSEAREESLFGELTRKFFDDRLELTLGGRLYQEKLQANITSRGLTGLLAANSGFTGVKKLEEKGFSPKAAVKFQWTDDILLYANAARGFQFGGFNAPAPLPSDNVFPPTFKPSTLWSYELGVRTDWFDNTLQLDLTAFHIDWTDRQLSQSTPSGNTDFTDNISGSVSQGVESSLRWLTPIPGLTLINTAAYIRATIEEPYTTADGVEIPVGTELPAAPRLQTATTLAYTRNFGSLVGGVNLTYAHIGEAFNNVEHDLLIFGFNTLDAGVKLSAPQWKLSPELSFYVTNLTNEQALLGGGTRRLLNIPTGDLGAFLRPRSAALRFSFYF